MQRPLQIAAALAVACNTSAQETTDIQAPLPASEPTSRYLLSDQPLIEAPQDLLWEGFLTGMQGFKHHYEPISNPLYNESPFIETQIKPLYIHHRFSGGNAIGDGEVNIAAVQARIALTDRLAFIATKDGYSWLNTGLTGEQEGFNDLALGLKYALIVDQENDFVLTGGARYQWQAGGRAILQGSARELSPFVSAAKGFDDFRLQANATYRIGIDKSDTNDVFQWSLHADYEITDGIAAVVEFNGLHYLTNGTRLPVNVGGYDYTNLGSSNVAGDSVVSTAIGAAFKLNPNVEVGATYEFPLNDADQDLLESRIVVAITLSL